MPEPGDRPQPSGGSAPGGDPLRDRLAHTRQSVAREMRDLAEQLARDEEGARRALLAEVREHVDARIAAAESGLSDSVSANLAAALAELEARVEGAIGESQSRLERASAESVRGEAERRFALAEARLATTLENRADTNAAALERRLGRELSSRLALAEQSLGGRLQERLDVGWRRSADDLARQLRLELEAKAAGLGAELRADSDRTLASARSALAREAQTRAVEGEERAKAIAVVHAREEARARTSSLEAALAERARRDVDERVAGAVAAVHAEGADWIGRCERSLSRRSRRHEVALARAESSRRVQRVLTKLETRAGAVLGELDERLARARARVEGDARAAEAEREDVERLAAEAGVHLREARAERERSERRLAAALDELERLGGAAGERARAGLGELDQALVRARESQERVLAIEQRVGQAELQVRRAGELADGAADVERRMASAARAEDEAARRIAAAERRLADLLGDDPPA